MEVITSLTPSTVPWSKDTAGCDVFVGVMPIRLPAFPRLLKPALARVGALHFFTVIQQPLPSPSYVYFDFLPENPEDPLVAVSVLLGKKVPGIVQERSLKRLPATSCWWIGKAEVDKGLVSARKFNSCWDNQLTLFHHDCRHYTAALVGHMTGNMDVIEQVIKFRKDDTDPASEFIHYT